MSIGFDKIAAAKQVCKILNIDIKEAKKLVYKTPFYIEKEVSLEEANKLKKIFNKIDCTVEIEEYNTNPLWFNYSKLTLLSTGKNKSEVSRIIKDITDFDANKIHEIVNNTPSTITLITDSNRVFKAKEDLEETGAKVSISQNID